MKKKSIRMITILTLSIALVLTACGSKTDESAAEDKSGKKTEDTKDGKTDSKKVFGAFQSKTLDGEDITQEVFEKADLTMVNIWGTFCGPCIREMPDLGELNREYEGKGFQVVGIVSDVGEPGDEKAEEIVTSTKADYVNIVAGGDLRSGILSQVSVVPTTIFVDKEGSQVGDVYSGARDKNGWMDIIESLLTEAVS